jgi:hypothetical protein
MCGRIVERNCPIEMYPGLRKFPLEYKGHAHEAVSYHHWSRRSLLLRQCKKLGRKFAR